MSAAEKLALTPELPFAVAMSPSDFAAQQRRERAEAWDSGPFVQGDHVEVYVSPLLADGVENWRWCYADGWQSTAEMQRRGVAE